MPDVSGSAGESDQRTLGDWSTARSRRVTARIQTGYLYTYALVMLLGVAAATTWVMAR